MQHAPHMRLDMDAELTLPDIIALDPHVSTRSRWSDRIWHLDGESGGQSSTQFAIHWTLKASPELLNAAKFLAARLFLERDGCSQLKHTTASNFSAGIRHLLRFMSNYAYSSFSQLDQDAFKLFVSNLHLKLSDPAWYLDEFLTAHDEAGIGVEDDPTGEDGEEALELDLGDVRDELPEEAQALVAPKDSEDDAFTRAAAYYRLRTWRFLFEHAGAMELAGSSALSFDPFANKSIREFTHEASRIAADLIPPLPDPIAIRIVNTAQRMMGSPADDVLRLQGEYIKIIARLDREPQAHERERIRAMMEAFKFSNTDQGAWHPPIVLPPDRRGGGDALRDLLIRVRDAAILVIFAGTGVRISELCSLIADPAKAPASLALFGEETAGGKRSLPHCVSMTISKTGLNEHFFMKGRLFKNERHPREETWLIGSRPRGDDVEPPVLRAIRVLERLYAPWRQLSDDEQVRGDLILGLKGRGLPRSATSIIPISAGSLRQSLRRFIKKHCRLAELADEMPISKALRPYVESEGGCIRPHQWRKTFALYMMKVDDRMIPPLAHHFKHMSIAVTENSYMPKDPSMLAASDSVHMQETARYFYEQVHGAGGSFGRLDDIVAEHRAEWEKLVADLPFEEALPQVQRFCLERDIRIFHAEHGRCLFGANPDKARCHEVSNTTSWRNSKPNHMTRTPGLCAGCSNFSVSIEHAGFWRRRYVANQTSWLQSDRSTQFRVIQKRAQQAEQILKALKQPLPMILTKGPGDASGRPPRHGAGGADLSSPNGEK